MMTQTATQEFIPSTYQQAIFNFIISGKGNAVIAAVAGSGKTTTLIEAAKLLRRQNIKALFVAFNKHIALPLGEKLKRSGIYNMEASTIHSLGNRILSKNGRCQIDDKKYRNLCHDYLMKHLDPAIFDKKYVQQMQNIVNFSMLTMTDPDNDRKINEMIIHYDIDVEMEDLTIYNTIMDGVQPVIDAGQEMYSNLHLIDFNDMVVLAPALKLVAPTYDLIFIDECQDLNAAQLELILSVKKSNGRAIFVGDRRQSLYGFTGADTNSINNIISRTAATILPLSICYRCPRKVIELAQQIVPEIQAADNAAPGSVEVLKEDGLISQVEIGDLVLCRTTAPLVSVCLSLLRSGIPATVKGRDIGKNLVDMIDMMKKFPVQGYPYNLYNLSHILINYKNNQLNILANKPDSEMLVQSIEDKVSTVLVLVDSYQMENNAYPSIDNLKKYIEGFFSDDIEHIVTCSTVHKAKGLEYKKVFIIEGQLMPHPAAKKDWQIEQEFNILYVALTRSQDKLYFVGKTPKALSIEGLPPVSSTVEGTTEEETTETPVQIQKRKGRQEGEKTGAYDSVTRQAGFAINNGKRVMTGLLLPPQLKGAVKLAALVNGKNLTDFIEELLISNPDIQRQLNIIIDNDIQC